MSFGDNSDRGPLVSILESTLGRVDSFLAPAIGGRIAKPAPAKPATSLASTPAPAPQPTDTPGRHKSLLGA